VSFFLATKPKASKKKAVAKKAAMASAAAAAAAALEHELGDLDDDLLAAAAERNLQAEAEAEGGPEGEPPPLPLHPAATAPRALLAALCPSRCCCEQPETTAELLVV